MTRFHVALMVVLTVAYVAMYLFIKRMDYLDRIDRE